MENNNNSIIVSKGGIGLKNPFTLKVGQVFTGFGVGCGLGIGVGKPINLVMKFGDFFKLKINAVPCAFPMLGQVTSAARGATDVFSGVGRHVNHSLKKFGVKNIDAGIGCGVGFGHGFGIGLALKPGVIQQLQTTLIQTATKLMTRFGVAPELSSVVTQGMSLQGGPLGNVMKSKTGDETEKLSSSSYASRTEKVINNFLQTPILEQGEAKSPQVGNLQSENDVIQLVLKQQVALEKLKEENEKLQKILIEDLKVSQDRFIVNNVNNREYSCSDCFECRMRQRRDRRR